MRREKRDNVAANAEEAAKELELQSKILKVTEFVTANELAKMMDCAPMLKFIDLKLHELVLSNLQKAGYETPTVS